MNTPRKLVRELGSCYGVAKTFGDLVFATGKPRAEVAAYLDQLVLDGVATRRILRLNDLLPGGPEFEVWELTDYSYTLIECGFPA